MSEDQGKKKPPQKIKEKFCAFPGCGVSFMGVGKAKYCDEHRQPKYRKELYKRNDNNGETNTIIKHNHKQATQQTCVCGLDGCENEFTITLLPRLYEYTKYCPEHRNHFKREMFTKLNGDIDE